MPFEFIHERNISSVALFTGSSTAVAALSNELLSLTCARCIIQLIFLCYLEEVAVLVTCEPPGKDVVAEVLAGKDDDAADDNG